jgi:YgiT-type zinc finger domain-containing protein
MLVATIQRSEPARWRAGGLPAEAKAIRCAICGNGGTKPGTATLVLERGGLTMVIRGVPAEVCENCGEEYFGEGIAENTLAKAEQAVREGAQVEVRD